MNCKTKEYWQDVFFVDRKLSAEKKEHVKRLKKIAFNTNYNVIGLGSEFW